MSRDETIQAVKEAQQRALAAWEIQVLEERRGERISNTLSIGQMVYQWRGGDHRGWAIIDDWDPECGYVGVRWCNREGVMHPGGAWLLPHWLSPRRVPCDTPKCEWSNGHPPGHNIDGKHVLKP